jgi:hypothetical protein
MGFEPSSPRHDMSSPAHKRPIPPTLDPVLAALASAPIDDEPETPEQREEARLARLEAERGEVCSTDEIRRSEDFR